jgi:hypothetical protein
MKIYGKCQGVKPDPASLFNGSEEIVSERKDLKQELALLAAKVLPCLYLCLHEFLGEGKVGKASLEIC